MNIAIREHNNDILFLHKLVPGPSDRSYGVEVARLAGVPVPVVHRARDILAALEKSRESGRKNLVAASLLLPGLEQGRPAPNETGAGTAAEAVAPAKPHPLLRQLEELEPEELSPLDALKLLMDWKNRWGAGEPPAPPGAGT